MDDVVVLSSQSFVPRDIAETTRRDGVIITRAGRMAKCRRDAAARTRHFSRTRNRFGKQLSTYPLLLLPFWALHSFLDALKMHAMDYKYSGHTKCRGTGMFLGSFAAGSKSKCMTGFDAPRERQTTRKQFKIEHVACRNLAHTDAIRAKTNR